MSCWALLFCPPLPRLKQDGFFVFEILKMITTENQSVSDCVKEAELCFNSFLNLAKLVGNDETQAKIAANKATKDKTGIDVFKLLGMSNNDTNFYTLKIIKSFGDVGASCRDISQHSRDWRRLSKKEKDFVLSSLVSNNLIYITKKGKSTRFVGVVK